MLVAPYSALSSWNGYVWQCHTAIRFFLNELEQLLDLEEDISKYSLGIEGEEDFCIIQEDKYITLNQVKAVEQLKLNTADKFCYIISILQYGKPKGFYHVKNTTGYTANFVETTLNEIDKLLSELENKVITKKELEGIKINKSDVEHKYIIIDNIKGNNKKGSIYSILKYKCTGQINKETVTAKIQEVKEELNEYKIELQNKEDKDYYKIEKVQFKNNSKLRDNSCEKIGEILNHGKFKYDKDHYKTMYYAMYQYIGERLENIVEADNGVKISFKVLYDIISKTYPDAYTNLEYRYLELYDDIISLYQDCSNSTNCEEENKEICRSKQECNLNSELEIVKNLEKDGIKDFLHKLLLVEPKKGIGISSLKHGLMKILYEIKALKYQDNNLILASKKEKIYRLSLEYSQEIEEFIENISDQKNIEKLLFWEADYIIGGINEECEILYRGNEFCMLGDKERAELNNISEENFNKDIMKPKKIKIINRVNAKKVLSENGKNG